MVWLGMPQLGNVCQNVEPNPYSSQHSSCHFPSFKNVNIKFISKNWSLLREERGEKIKKREKKGRGNASSSRDLPSSCPLQALEKHGQLHLPRVHCSPDAQQSEPGVLSFSSMVPQSVGGSAWFSWAAFCLPIAKSGSQAPFQYSEPYQPPPQCILGLCIFTFLA